MERYNVVRVTAWFTKNSLVRESGVDPKADYAALPLLASHTGRYNAPKNTSATTSNHSTYHGHGKNRKGDAVTGAAHRYM